VYSNFSHVVQGTFFPLSLLEIAIRRRNLPLLHLILRQPGLRFRANFFQQLCRKCCEGDNYVREQEEKGIKNKQEVKDDIKQLEGNDTNQVEENDINPLEPADNHGAARASGTYKSTQKSTRRVNSPEIALEESMNCVDVHGDHPHLVNEDWEDGWHGGGSSPNYIGVRSTLCEKYHELVETQERRESTKRGDTEEEEVEIREKKGKNVEEKKEKNEKKQAVAVEFDSWESNYFIFDGDVAGTTNPATTTTLKNGSKQTSKKTANINDNADTVCYSRSMRAKKFSIRTGRSPAGERLADCGTEEQNEEQSAEQSEEQSEEQRGEGPSNGSSNHDSSNRSSASQGISTDESLADSGEILKLALNAFLSAKWNTDDPPRIFRWTSPEIEER
jgi:hypothetical protein